MNYLSLANIGIDASEDGDQVHTHQLQHVLCAGRRTPGKRQFLPI